MNTIIEIVGYGGLIPAAVSMAIFLLCRRLLPDAASQRYAAAAAVAIAFFAGYALLPWTDFVPKRHWQWLPYLGAAAMLAGPLALASGILRAERWLVHLLLSLAAAWMLVPTWSTLQPPRPVHIGILAACLFLLIAALDALPSRLTGLVFLAQLTIVSAAVALLLAVSISVTFGQLAGIATASLGGCCVGAIIGRPPAAARGLIPVFAVLVGGLAFIGCIEPQQPQYGMLLAAAAPLALWSCARLDGKMAAIAQTAAVLAPLAIALVWVLAS